MIEINIPCKECGCNDIQGICIKDGQKVSISICACNGGDGYYDLTIKNTDEFEEYFRFKSKDELESILSNCYFPENSNFRCNDCYSCH